MNPILVSLAQNYPKVLFKALAYYYPWKMEHLDAYYPWFDDFSFWQTNIQWTADGYLRHCYWADVNDYPGSDEYCSWWIPELYEKHPELYPVYDIGSYMYKPWPWTLEKFKEFAPQWDMKFPSEAWQA